VDLVCILTSFLVETITLLDRSLPPSSFGELSCGLEIMGLCFRDNQKSSPNVDSKITDWIIQTDPFLKQHVNSHHCLAPCSQAHPGGGGVAAADSHWTIRRQPQQGWPETTNSLRIVFNRDQSSVWRRKKSALKMFRIYISSIKNEKIEIECIQISGQQRQCGTMS